MSDPRDERVERRRRRHRRQRRAAEPRCVVDGGPRLAARGLPRPERDLGHALLRGDAHEAAAERWRKRWVEERLKEIGLERARRWGWPNTYSYSKSLGEQLVFAAQDSIAATVARPSASAPPAGKRLCSWPTR